VIENYTIPYTNISLGNTGVTIANSLTNVFVGFEDTLYQFDINGDFSSPQSKVNVTKDAFQAWNNLIASSSTVGFVISPNLITVFNYNTNPIHPTTTASTASSTYTTSTTSSGSLGEDNKKYFIGGKKHRKRNNIHDNVRRKKDKLGVNVKKIKLNPKRFTN